jgi:hypothetical protein
VVNPVTSIARCARPERRFGVDFGQLFVIALAFLLVGRRLAGVTSRIAL